jgi:hypothetical protein
VPDRPLEGWRLSAVINLKFINWELLEGALMTASSTKTDDQLRRDVEVELDWEPSVSANQVGVAVRDAVVTLSGQVESYWEKWSAVRATERVAGVRGVANELEVNSRMSVPTATSPNTWRTSWTGAAQYPTTKSKRKSKRAG